MTPGEAWGLIEQGLLPSEHERARAEFRDLLARIWDEGCEHGGRNGHSDHWRQHEEDPDLAHWPYDDNPYRASEAA